MQMIRIGICDDDMDFSSAFEEQVERLGCELGYQFNIDVFTGTKDLIDTMEREGAYDLLFLDIELGSQRGMDIGNFIRNEMKNEILQIVYVSSKQSYAMELFETRPLQFLVKPVNDESLKRVLESYLRLFCDTNNYFLYQIGKQQHRIHEKYIMYFQSLGRKIQMYTTEGVIEFYDKLSEIEKRVMERNFCRVHKSYLVNGLYVKEFHRDYLLMNDENAISISRSMRENVMQWIQKQIE